MEAIVELLKQNESLDQQLRAALSAAEAQLQDGQHTAQVLGLHALAMRPFAASGRAEAEIKEEGASAMAVDEQPTESTRLEA